MKRSVSSILIFCFAILFSMQGRGQSQNIRVPLTGNENFREINEKTAMYLKTVPESYEKERFIKHYSRWAYYQSLHLGPSGEFVNIPEKTMEAVNQQGDAPLTSANGSWTFIGPTNSHLNNPSADLLGNGRVDRIAFHPTNPSIIYVGTPAGGLWKTADGGTTWTALSNFIPSLGISGIVVDYSNPNTIYILTGDGDAFLGNSYTYLLGYLRTSVGVLVTHDAGTTWQATGFNYGGYYAGYRLIQHPTDPNILLAATNVGLFRTSNAGISWTRVATQRFFDIEFKPGSPSTVYASGSKLFACSTDGGVTWNTNSTFDHALCENGRIEIAVTPANPNKVFLLSGPSTNNMKNFCGFYVSTNSGVSFTRQTDTPNILGDESGESGDQSNYDLGLAVSRTNDQKIFPCGLIVWKSINGGTSFSNASTYRESGGNYIHPDCHDIAINPLNNYIYVASDGGLYRTTNEGASWTSLFAGINTAMFYHLDDYDANPDVILGGCQDDGIKFRNSNTSDFSQIMCCDGSDAAMDYSTGYSGIAAYNDKIIKYSDFTGASPYQISGTGSYFPQVELNSSDPGILFYSYSGVYKYNFIFGSIALGGNDLRGGWVVRTCLSNSNRLYTAGGDYSYATTGAVFTSADEGLTWSTISSNTGFPATFNRISDIGVRPNNSSQVYVCFSGYTAGQKVLYSYNAGLTWTNISYDLPNIPIWSIQVDAANNVYIGGDVGVYYHEAGSTNWEPFYNGIPNVPVSGLAINESADQLLAATFGRGIWKSSLRTGCPADLLISTNVSGPYFRSASNSVTMSGTVTGGEGTSAVLRSGNYVTLSQGFEVTGTGNQFHAYIGPCGSGMPAMTQSQASPVFPPEVDQFPKPLTRHDGTLEIKTGADGHKVLILRLFSGGSTRIILATSDGRFIRNIADFEGHKGKTTYNLEDDLGQGLYYLYLVVNGQVTHLQELAIN